MIQIKKTILTLVALLAVTTGAWATTVTWVTEDFFNTGSAAFTKYDVTVTPSNNDARHSNFFYANGANTFTTTLGNFTKIEIVFMPSSSPITISGWDYELIEAVQPEPEYEPNYWQYTSKLTWTGDAESVSIQGAVNNIKSITFTIAEPSSGPKVAWNAEEKSGTFKMPGGNVTLEPEYYPQATVADGGVTAADADARATTDDPLVKVDATKLTGAKKLMYFVSNSGTPAPAYDAEGWTDQLPTAEKFTQQGIVYVYYYPVGTDENVDGATATYSDGDICLQSITARIAAAPTYAVKFAEGTPETDKWKAEPNAGVKKGETVTVTYTGSKKVIGVKAEKKAAAPASTPLDNTTTAWSAGTFVVPAGGLTYSDAITVSGDVTLVLTDGETLTLNKGISLASGATLTIEGNGTMVVNGTNNSTASTVAGSTGTLKLTSGTLTATGGNGGSVGQFTDDSHGGNGGDAINGSVIVSGGTLTARGGNGGSVGDFCENCSGGNGGDAISGTLTINGGSTSVNNGSNGSIGEDCDDCSAGTGGKAVAGTVTDNR
jgi:hypothetical protein